ncbi:unnamed protein product [Symbiodinium natans]|uniref:Uncharacterized protein n=1 Tax=Symbiodinium natans TaxID=878477 RepID=A0A812QGW9_9DINO|nr:unnamed protein product [Symbiodinium natans]
MYHLQATAARKQSARGFFEASANSRPAHWLAAKAAGGHVHVKPGGFSSCRRSCLQCLADLADLADTSRSWNFDSAQAALAPAEKASVHTLRSAEAPTEDDRHKARKPGGRGMHNAASLCRSCSEHRQGSPEACVGCVSCKRDLNRAAPTFVHVAPQVAQCRG